MAVLTVQPLSSGLNETVSTSVSGLTQQPATPIFINTNDTVATVTTTGYLNAAKQLYGSVFIDKQMAQVFTTDSGADWYKISISGVNTSLVALEGSVTLPVVDGDFAVFNGTSGGLRDDGFAPSDPDESTVVMMHDTALAAGNFAVFRDTDGTLEDLSYSPTDESKTKIVMLDGSVLTNSIAYFTDASGTIKSVGTDTITHNGSLQLGSSGNVGNLTLYPVTAAKGAMIIAAAANSDNYDINIRNAAFGQASTLTIPDPGAATANFIMSKSGSTQHIATGSLEVDAGSFIAGSDANAGELVSYPATTASGTFIVGASNSAGAFNTVLTNNSLGQTTTFKLPDPGVATAGILVSTITAPDNNANLIRFDVTATAAALAAAASVTLFTSSGAKQYKIINLWVNSGGTNFSGGGGDRLLDITDNTTVYSVVPAASLQTLVNTAWGVAGLPFPASAAINTSTTAGSSLICRYSGGAADYGAGSVVISGLLQRVA